MSKFKNIEVYVSIVSSRNSKNIFSYGYVAKSNGETIKTGAQNYKNTTNNRVELFAMCNIAYLFENECDNLSIFTHNNYVVQVLSNRNRNYDKNLDAISKFRDITKSYMNISIFYKCAKGISEFRVSNQLAISALDKSPKEDNKPKEQNLFKKETHTVEYHEIRIKSLFASKGINLNKYTLSLYAQIYANPYWLTNFDDSIKHLGQLSEFMKRDHDNGIDF